MPSFAFYAREQINGLDDVTDKTQGCNIEILMSLHPNLSYVPKRSAWDLPRMVGYRLEPDCDFALYSTGNVNYAVGRIKSSW